MRVEGRPLASLSDIQVGLQADAAFRFGASLGTVKRDGSFTLSNIGPDHYRFNAFGLPEDYYIKSALLGDKEALDSLLDFTQGASGNLDILLSSNGGQVEGVVLKCRRAAGHGSRRSARSGSSRGARDAALQGGRHRPVRAFQHRRHRAGRLQAVRVGGSGEQRLQGSGFLKTFEAWANAKPYAKAAARAPS